jgi:hypothetical protein
MRRIQAYIGESVYEWAFSSPDQNTMVAIAKVCSAMMGSNVTVNGLTCSPTAPASMTVQIGAGELYQMAPLEATVCGTLPQDTTHQILKQGIQLGTYTTSTFATPGSSGQSINYLIEAQYADSDISLDPTTGNTTVVLQFYNSANPQTPWSGPNNSGQTSNTFRDGIIAYQIKAGTAATTGTQVTPSPDTGWIGLWVITVAYGATSLTSANIAQYTGSPVLPTGILQSILTSNLTYGVDSGSANTVQAKFPIPVATLTDGLDVWVKIAAANTGATTFTPNPGVISASPVIGAAHAALQGGELVVGGRANLIWRQDVSSWVLVECTGAAIQVAPATASNHAMQLGQATGRLLNIQTFNSSGTYTPTAGTTHCRVTVVGGGASGGGAQATASAQVAYAGGGGGGGAAIGYYPVASLTGQAVTVGAGGATSSTTGNSGGTSSVGAVISATGGSGASAGFTAAPPTIASGGAGGTGSGGNIFNGAGSPGQPGLGIAVSNACAGSGGGSIFSLGVIGPFSGTLTGNAGVGPGCGSSGAASQNGGAAKASLNASAGVVIFEEFA